MSAPIVRKAVLPEYVRYKDKFWFNPDRPLDDLGRMSLWSLTHDGQGVLANPDEVVPATAKQWQAISEMVGTRVPR